jgi:hypothetical protein
VTPRDGRRVAPADRLAMGDNRRVLPAGVPLLVPAGEGAASGERPRAARGLPLALDPGPRRHCRHRPGTRLPRIPASGGTIHGLTAG